MNIKPCSYCHTKSHTYSIFHAYLYWYYSVFNKWLNNVPIPESHSSQMTFICSGQQPCVPSEECKSNSKPMSPCTKTAVKCTTCRLHLTSQGVEKTCHEKHRNVDNKKKSVLSIPQNVCFFYWHTVPQILPRGFQIQINIFTVYLNCICFSDKHLYKFR